MKLEIDPKRLRIENIVTAREIIRRDEASEHERYTILISKTQSLLMITTIVFASLSIKDFNNLLARHTAVFAFLFGAISAFHSLSLLMSATYKVVNSNGVLDRTFLESEPSLAELRNLMAVRDCIVHNRPVLESMFEKFNQSVIFLMIATCFAFSSFSIQAIWSVTDGK